MFKKFVLIIGLVFFVCSINGFAQEDEDPLRQAFVEELDTNYKVLVTQYHLLESEIAQLRTQEPLDRGRIRTIKSDRKAIKGLGISLYRAKQGFADINTLNANSNISLYNAGSDRFRTAYNFKYIVVPDELHDLTDYWNTPEGCDRKTLFDQESELAEERGRVRQAQKRQQENLNQYEQQYLRFQEQIIASFSESLSEMFRTKSYHNIYGKRWDPLAKLPSIEINSEGPPQVIPPQRREIEPLPELSDDFRDLLRKFRVGQIDGWQFVGQIEEIMSEEMQAMRRYQGQTGYENRVYDVKRALIDWDYSKQWHQNRLRKLSEQSKRLDARIQAIDTKQDQYRNTDLPPNIDQDFPPDVLEEPEQPDEDEPSDKQKSKNKTFKRKPVKVSYIDCSLRLINDISARHAALSRLWTQVTLAGAKVLEAKGFQTAIVPFTEMLVMIRQMIANLEGVESSVRVCTNKEKVIDTINDYNNWVATLDQELYEDYDIDPIGQGVMPPEEVPEEKEEQFQADEDWSDEQYEGQNAEEERRMKMWDNAPVYDKDGNIVKKGSELDSDDMYYYKLVVDEATGEVSWHAKTNTELRISDTQSNIDRFESDLRHNQWQQNEMKFKLREEKESLGLPEYDVKHSNEMVEKINQKLERLRGGIPTDEVRREIKQNERWLGEWEEKLEYTQAELRRSQEYLESLENQKTSIEKEQDMLEQRLEDLKDDLSGLTDGT